MPCVSCSALVAHPTWHMVPPYVTVVECTHEELRNVTSFGDQKRIIDPDPGPVIELVS